MSMAVRVLYSIATIVGTIYVTTAIFAFFGIGFDVYGSYLLFMVAMLLMYGFLPQQRKGIFDPKNV